MRGLLHSRCEQCLKTFGRTRIIVCMENEGKRITVLSQEAR